MGRCGFSASVQHPARFRLQLLQAAFQLAFLFRKAVLFFCNRQQFLQFRRIRRVVIQLRIQPFKQGQLRLNRFELFGQLRPCPAFLSQLPFVFGLLLIDLSRCFAEILDDNAQKDDDNVCKKNPFHGCIFLSFETRLACDGRTPFQRSEAARFL